MKKCYYYTGCFHHHGGTAVLPADDLAEYYLCRISVEKIVWTKILSKPLLYGKHSLISFVLNDNTLVLTIYFRVYVCLDFNFFTLPILTSVDSKHNTFSFSAITSVFDKNKEHVVSNIHFVLIPTVLQL